MRLLDGTYENIMWDPFNPGERFCSYLKCKLSDDKETKRNAILDACRELSGPMAYHAKDVRLGMMIYENSDSRSLEETIKTLFNGSDDLTDRWAYTEIYRRLVGNNY